MLMSVYVLFIVHVIILAFGLNKESIDQDGPESYFIKNIKIYGECHNIPLVSKLI